MLNVVMLNVASKPFTLNVANKPFMLNLTNKPFMLNVANKLSVVILNVTNKGLVLNLFMLSVVALVTYLFESFVVKTLIKGRTE